MFLMATSFKFENTIRVAIIESTNDVVKDKLDKSYMTTLIEVCTFVSNSIKDEYHDLLHQHIFDSLTRKIDPKFGDV